jgi:hypothetical protein
LSQKGKRSSVRSRYVSMPTDQTSALLYDRTITACRDTMAVSGRYKVGWDVV